jgi:Zn-dependent protease
MHTLFDYISNVYAIQYGLALLFIVGFIIFHELLKPRPFAGLVRASADDAAYIRHQGRGPALRLLKSIALGPFYALVYVAAIPVLFVHAVAVLLSRVVIASTSVGWSPVQAYFISRRGIRRVDRR